MYEVVLRYKQYIFLRSPNVNVLMFSFPKILFVWMIYVQGVCVSGVGVSVSLHMPQFVDKGQRATSVLLVAFQLF